jgi:phosphate transport system substrate-binding protein
VDGLGSTGGVKAVTAGVLDFALVGRPLKAEEQRAGLVAFEYGRTPFVIVTNKQGVENLSLVQLASMIASDNPVWADGSPVRLVLRPVADADTALLGAFSPAMKDALAVAHKRGGMVRAITDGESADESERLPGSLGTSSVALLQSEKRVLKVLSLDGMLPTLQNFASGAYPHGKTMSIATKGKPNEATQKFLDFMSSDEGRQILVRLGHLLPSAP